MLLLSIFSYWPIINFQPRDDEGVEKNIGKYVKGCQKNEKNSNNESIRKDVENVKKKLNDGKPWNHNKGVNNDVKKQWVH